MLYHVIRLAAFVAALAALSFAQPAPLLPMNLVARTEVDPNKRWVIFHSHDAARSPEFVAAVVRLLKPKRDVGSNPLRARIWPPRIATPAPGEVVVDLDARVPGLARLLAPGAAVAGTR
jgi:hypothetical protein